MNKSVHHLLNYYLFLAREHFEWRRLCRSTSDQRLRKSSSRQQPQLRSQAQRMLRTLGNQRSRKNDNF